MQQFQGVKAERYLVLNVKLGRAAKVRFAHEDYSPPAISFGSASRGRSCSA
jgi:hypothetical protein